VRSWFTTTRAGRLACYAVLGISLVVITLVNRSMLAALALVFVVVVPCEKLWPRHRQRIRRPGLATDLAWALSQPLLRVVAAVVAIAFALVSLVWIPGLLLHPLVARLPEVWRLGLGALLFDLLGYWGHRLDHEVPFLWRFHSVHHSSERLDWVSGFRAHPFDVVAIAPPAGFLLAAGFGGRVTGVLAVIQIVVGLFLHANVRWQFRPLARVVATPEFHHWHHSSEPDAINRNYAGLLPVWDILFGTWFQPEAGRRPQVYGTATPVPVRFVPQLVAPFEGMRDPRLVLRHPVAELRSSRPALARGAAQVRHALRRPNSRR
jgi:sterol desaturase/sphingolipid hydroxylase (fatty acid hydroxylase superfamily)